MSMWTRLQVARAARRNAELGITPAVETVVNATIGMRPSLTPSNPRHARLIRNLRPSGAWQDRSEELREREQTATAYLSPLVYFLGIIVVTVVDVVSAVRVMHDMGLPKEDRLPFAVGLALGLFGLTAMTVRRAGSSVPGAASWARRLGLFGLCLIYGGVVLALAASRTEVVGEQSLLNPKVLPQLAILSVISCGPGFAFEYLIRRFVEARRLGNGIRQIRQDQRSEDRQRKEAERQTERLSLDTEAWDREAGQLVALYNLEYARAAARRGERPMLPLTPMEGESDETA